MATVRHRRETRRAVERHHEALAAIAGPGGVARIGIFRGDIIEQRTGQAGRDRADAAEDDGTRSCGQTGQTSSCSDALIKGGGSGAGDREVAGAVDRTVEDQCSSRTGIDRGITGHDHAVVEDRRTGSIQSQGDKTDAVESGRSRAVSRQGGNGDVVAEDAAISHVQDQVKTRPRYLPVEVDIVRAGEGGGSAQGHRSGVGLRSAGVHRGGRGEGGRATHRHRAAGIDVRGRKKVEIYENAQIAARIDVRCSVKGGGTDKSDVRARIQDVCPRAEDSVADEVHARSRVDGGVSGEGGVTGDGDVDQGSQDCIATSSDIVSVGLSRYRGDGPSVDRRGAADTGGQAAQFVRASNHATEGGGGRIVHREIVSRLGNPVAVYRSREGDAHPAERGAGAQDGVPQSLGTGGGHRNGIEASIGGRGPLKVVLDLVVRLGGDGFVQRASGKGAGVEAESRNLAVEGLILHASRSGAAAETARIVTTAGTDSRCVSAIPIRVGGCDAGGVINKDAVDKKLHGIRSQVDGSHHLNPLANPAGTQQTLNVGCQAVFQPRYGSCNVLHHQGSVSLNGEARSRAAASLPENLVVGRSDGVGIDPEFPSDGTAIC